MSVHLLVCSGMYSKFCPTHHSQWLKRCQLNRGNSLEAGSGLGSRGDVNWLFVELDLENKYFKSHGNSSVVGIYFCTSL